MEWKPIDDAIKCNKIKVLARDADGMERWTWFEDGGWLYAGWRETEDREEYASEEWWTPTEYTPDA